jgi:dolichyl-phosphate-mannose-protein mannosyltransferase
MKRVFFQIWPKISRNELCIATILLVFALAIRLFLFWYPKQFVFDEVYFIKFVSDYMSHAFYFDQHPPLGKLLLYVFGTLIGFNGPSQIHTIGENFLNNAYFYLRLLPIVCGSLLAAVIFFLARTLKMSLPVAILAGIAVVFENSLVVNSRLVLLDMFLLLFGFFGLLFYFKFREKRKENTSKNKILLFKILSIIFLTFSFCIKWTGLSYIAIAGAIELYPTIKKYFDKIAWREIRKDLLNISIYFLFIPIIIYVSIFYFHFGLLYKSGSGDAFMSQQFQSTLIKEAATSTNNIKEQSNISQSVKASIQNVNKLPFLVKFFELNEIMYKANATMNATHSYSSKWYTWPLDIRGIYYWNGDENRMIYLLGNPFIYWLGTMSVLLCLAWSIKERFRDKLGNFILFGYFLNLLPFMLIGRVMFLYHYFTALIFSILCLGYILDKIQNKKRKIILVSAILLVFISSFLYFSPLTYGIKDANIFNRFWLASWR